MGCQVVKRVYAASINCLLVGRLKIRSIVSPARDITIEKNLHMNRMPSRYVPFSSVEIRIEPTRASPSAAPNCRAVLFNAEPIANLDCGRKAVAELEMVEMHNPTPMPVYTITGR